MAVDIGTTGVVISVNETVLVQNQANIFISQDSFLLR